MRNAILAATALALAGCATTYEMTLMPRDSGRTYTGTLTDVRGGEGTITVSLEGRTYTGSWVQTTPAYTQGWVSGFGFFGRRGWGGMGTTVTLDNPQGAEAKALLSAPDGSGLRCDFRSGQGYGGGVCRDDRGREYDVQLRPAPR